MGGQRVSSRAIDSFLSLDFDAFVICRSHIQVAVLRLDLLLGHFQISRSSARYPIAS